MALTELRREAHNLGADAVEAVDLDYSEVAGAGGPMMFLVASGTAIEIDNDRLKIIQGTTLANKQVSRLSVTISTEKDLHLTISNCKF